MSAQVPLAAEGRTAVGVGWRPPIADTLTTLLGIDFCEVTFEDVAGLRRLPPGLRALRERGIPMVLHAVSLNLGSPQAVDPAHLDGMARAAELLDCRIVSDHACFVRGGGLDAGHLLPLPGDHEAVDALVANIQRLRARVSIPVAVENIATLFRWPDAQFTEAEFLSAVLREADALLLLDLENVHANQVNHGIDGEAFLDGLPLDRLAYLHLAGGEYGPDGLYHDTHAHSVPPETLNLLQAVCERTSVPGALVERDDRFPAPAGLAAEVQQIRRVVDACR